jgi:hypothetical protein
MREEGRVVVILCLYPALLRVGELTPLKSILKKIISAIMLGYRNTQSEVYCGNT